jgi:hypothetical protein
MVLHGTAHAQGFATTTGSWAMVPTTIMPTSKSAM